MPILDQLYKVAFWFFVFGGTAYVLYRWGKVGMMALASTDGLAELIKILWAIIKRPLVLACLSIFGFFIWFFYHMAS